MPRLHVASPARRLMRCTDEVEPTLALHVDHPERCEAARCTVPSFSDVVIKVIARGGRVYVQTFEKRICLGHYYAFQRLIAQLVRRGNHGVSMHTAAEVAAARSQQSYRFAHVTVGGFTTSNGTYTTTSTHAPWGF